MVQLPCFILPVLDSVCPSPLAGKSVIAIFSLLQRGKIKKVVEKINN